MPDLLTFDAVFEVKSSEGSYSDSFISVSAMEENCSLLERLACPLLKSMKVSQELDVLFTEHKQLSRWSQLGSWLDGVSTNMLNTVVGDVQGL